jgi:4-aminobutyrate aminotransferase-like enzyme
VRGRGLLAGIEFVKDKRTKQPLERSKTFVERVTSECFKNGLILTGGSGGADGVEGDHIIISPPFTVTESQIDEIIEILNDSILRVIDQMG